MDLPRITKILKWFLESKQDSTAFQFTQNGNRERKQKKEMYIKKISIYVQILKSTEKKLSAGFLKLLNCDGACTNKLVFSI